MPFVTSNSPQEMPTGRFPLEIYELFIDELSGSREFLQSSSLVSYAWLFRCRTHLFRRFRLRYVPPSGDVGDNDSLYCWYPTRQLNVSSDAVAEELCSLEELLKVQQIRQSIRELSFIEGEVMGSSRYMMHSFGKSLFELAASVAFPKLHSLDISFRASGPRDCCSGVIAMQEIMRINPTLERLCVSSLYLDNHCLQTFLRSFRLCSQLSNIQLRCITCTTHTKSSLSLCSSAMESEMNTVKLHRTFRPTIRTLSLSDVNPDLVEVLFSPAKPDVFKMADLKTLAIDCSDLEGKYRTLEKNKGFRIIESHASSLQHLLLLNHPKNIDHAVYKALFSTTLPHLSTLEMHFVNVHDGSFRHVLEKLCSLHSPLSDLHIGLKYGPRTAFTPPLDRSITKFAQSLRSLRRVRFQVTQMIDEFRCEHLPQAALILQLEIVQEGM